MPSKLRSMKRRRQNAAAEENAENEHRQQHPATKQQGQQNLNQQRAQMGEDEEQTEQPPRKITTNKVEGQKREYHFLKTVKSMEELDKFRSKNYCLYSGSRPLHIKKSIIIQCSRKKARETCAFELLALAPDLETGNIHVYAHSQHNHPFMAAERRALIRRDKKLMPAQNPPKNFVTPDKIKWTFLQTFSNYDKMQKIRLENLCQFRSWKNICRVRFRCQRRYSKHNCPFMLLAMKNTKEGYHVYKHGQHTHPLNRPKENQPARGHPNPTEMEDEDGEEEEKEEEDDEEDDEEESREGGEEEQQQDDENIDEVEEILIEEEEEDDIIVIEDEEQREKEEVEEKIEIIIKENPLTNPREETLEEKLAKANEKVYKWMAGVGPNEIGQTIGDWDKLSLLKIVEMADLEIRENPEKLNFWFPWLKCAIPKCLPQIEGFNVRYKDLIKLTFN